MIPEKVFSQLNLFALACRCKKEKKKYSLSICEAAITSERERTEGKVCAERKEDMSVIYILLC